VKIRDFAEKNKGRHLTACLNNLVVVAVMPQLAPCISGSHYGLIAIGSSSSSPVFLGLTSASVQADMNRVKTKARTNGNLLSVFITMGFKWS
jgi:hypothetical protein